ncbi:S8 family serine peptidase [Flammeovirgaceae bacterium SG7u.111]|nr:S8 family serine peptidase [Flammeovirgaceae bacterium SG7u.132]WPO36808.1 S8 family serine peptidase [Flammeovirgaceae bacterium SG7u.111]
MRIAIIITAMVILSSFQVSAQAWQDVTNTQYLKTRSAELSETFWKRKAEAEKLALEKNLPIRGATASGEVFEIVGITQFGQPIYYTLFNEKAAITSGSQRLSLGEGLGLDITGKGMLVGVWDGGNFLETHQEFQGRAETRGSITDDPLGLSSDHSTHVTGTIIAGGVDPQARGMAYEANAFVYDFANDDAEISNELSQGLLLLSNHSYGRVLGWTVNSAGTGWTWLGEPSISSSEDYLFGFYNEKSRLWDEFTTNAPYYLMVQAAGNDRTDVGDGSRPPDGPYDCIGPQGIAKNVLTVGAVEAIENGYSKPEDIIMSKFSSWGPADDGRIKPDIVADGVAVYSSLASSPSAYDTLSGTSMATPTTTGSLTLLQQLYSETHASEYMLSATLKGLVIHTANEAGPELGPDYQHGWGLLSTDKAAALIQQEDNSNNLIRELTIRDQQTQFISVQSNGVQPVVATICWTDQPGSPVAPQLDPADLMLVNDLDMRITDPLGNTFSPWILDPSRVDQAATTGDNFRDNVEKIEILDPVPGTYTIQITHKNTLEEPQNFSLIVSTSSLDLDFTTYYWVGKAGGEWNDPLNWSLSSNGAAGVGVPSITNPVVFDANSITTDNASITFNDDAACFNITWKENANNATFDLGTNTLSVNGNFTIDSELVKFTNGAVELSGPITKKNSIKAPAMTLAESDIIIKANSASWNMLSDLTTKSITIESGSLSAVDKKITSPSFDVTFGAGQELNITNSELLITEQFSLSSTLLADFENSTIRFSNADGASSFTFDGGGKQFHNIIAEGVDLTIEGNNNSFNKLTVDGSIQLTGASVIDSLTATAGSSISFQGGVSHFINEDFSVMGTAANPIVIQGEGGLATLETDDPTLRFCFDYINVTNVAIEGRTDYVSGNNSTISVESIGWLIGDCSDALFGAFEADLLCELGKAQFEDKSTGSPTSWEWDFGDKQFPERNTSTEQHPNHIYSFPGTYTVTLKVSDGTLTRTLVRNVEVNENNSGLAVPIILIDGETLESSLVSSNYQWYKDGVAIAGATNRSITASDPGGYQVEVFNDQCRFISEPTIINGLGDFAELNGLQLYPNPASQEVFLALDNEQKGEMKIGVFNLLGKQLLELNTKKTGYSFEVNMPIDQLPQGLYLLKVELGNYSSSKRFIKK